MVTKGERGVKGMESLNLKKGSGVGAVAAAAGIGLCVTLCGAAVVAKLAETEILPEEKLGYGVMLVLLAASWTGGLLGKNKMKKQVLPVCLACGIGYFGLLILLTALFFGGEYSGVGASGLMILCGSILAAMTGTGQGRRGKRLKRKRSNR